MIPNDPHKLTAAQLELLSESDPWSSLPSQKKEPYWVVKKRMDAERAERRKLEPKAPPKSFKDDEPSVPEPTPPPSVAHTCGPKQPGETWGEYGARNKGCPGCKAEEDTELEAGFIGRAEDEPEVARPGDVEERPGDVGHRYHPGEFGTGRPAPVHRDDSRIVKILKTLRDTGGERWTRRGDHRAGKRIRKKELCRAFHTCPPQGGQDYSMPTDDEFGEAPRPGSNTFNRITGEPHPEYLQYYLDKENCDACRGLRGRGDKEFCANKVSTEFGRAKPYCKDHIKMGQSYPSEVDKMLGNLPDFNEYEDESRKSSTSEFRKEIGKNVRVGDRVKFYFNKPGLKGTGHLVGTVVNVDPSGAATPEETHRVHWDNPKAQALAYTWEDPYSLDFIDVRDKPFTGGKELKPGSGQGWPPPSGIGDL